MNSQQPNQMYHDYADDPNYGGNYYQDSNGGPDDDGMDGGIETNDAKRRRIARVVSTNLAVELTRADFVYAGVRHVPEEEDKM